MADDVVANAGVGGATFRALLDSGGTDYWPAAVVSYVTGGSAGAWTLAPVDLTHGMPVQPMTGATWAATQSGAWNITNVTGTISLPTGASTSAKQPALGTAGSASTDVLSVQGIAAMTPLLVTLSGTNNIATVTAVTAITNALPAGSNVIGHVITDTGSTTAVTGNVAVTQATGTNLHTVVDSGTVTTVSTVTSLSQFAGTAIDVNSGNKGNGTLRVVLATDQPALTNKLLVTPDANSAINVAQVGGTNTVSGGVNGTLAVGGNVATNVAIGTNPMNLGAQAVSAENTAVTATRMAQLVTDLVGKLIVLPYANPENFVSGAITSAMTGTTTTSLLAAPASGLRNYITQITVSNAHATVGTDIIIQDGSGGTTLYTIPAAAVYGGAAITFPTPLRQPTTATAIYCANVTTGASTKVSASGYKGA